jgi:hypothetical protein
MGTSQLMFDSTPATIAFAVAALLLTMCPARALDPVFSETMTVFHVNPKQYGAVPLNMDTADGTFHFSKRHLLNRCPSFHPSRIRIVGVGLTES